MVFITNTINFPIIILIWLIDAYLFLAVVRLIIARIAGTRQKSFYQQLSLLTDWLPNIVGKYLIKFGNVSSPSWLCWVIVIIIGCILRQILISMIVVRVV